MRSRIIGGRSDEEVDELFERIESLEQQSRDLRAQLAEAAPAPVERRLDRRNLLRLGGVAAAVGASSVVLRPSAAGATTGAMQLAQQNDAGTDSTGITSSNATDTMHVSNSAGAPALQVRSAAAGVVAFGGTGGGVVGTTGGSGPGLWGKAAAGTGPAVKAEVDAATATAATIEAAQSGNGVGVFSHIDNPTSGGESMHALTKGTGHALVANIANTGSKAAAVSAITNGPGIALDAASALGIGGRFVGKTAQIQLVPTSASSHPATGIAGELFVDRSSRLWFCKGGTNWHQLA